MRTHISNTKIMQYAKHPETPIKLNSITASRLYLNNLVTHKGLHILYHRIGSMFTGEHPVDHYEIMSSDNLYEDLYISIYNDTNEWIPTKGYLFDSGLEFIWDNLTEYQQSEINEPEIEIDKKYMFQDKGTDDLDEELKKVKMLPALEIYLDESFGTNGCVKNFPYPLIEELMKNQFMFSAEKMETILSLIKPRSKYN